MARGLERARIRIYSEHFEALSEQIDDVSSRAAAGIEDPHSRRDTPAEKLIEQVDIDRSELVAEVDHEESIIQGRYNPTKQSGTEFLGEATPCSYVFSFRRVWTLPCRCGGIQCARTGIAAIKNGNATATTNG
jgi:hypothetical protein